VEKNVKELDRQEIEIRSKAPVDRSGEKTRSLVSMM
jgi:hypothetical protein